MIRRPAHHSDHDSQGGVEIPRAVRRYLGRDERVLLMVREHPFAIAAAFLRAVSTLIPLALVMWGAAGVTWIPEAIAEWIEVLALVGMLATVLSLAFAVLRWELAKLLVTDEKVMYSHGVLDRRVASTPLVRIGELTVYQPLVGRFFDFGRLMVASSGGTEQPLHGLRYLPSPDRIYRVIIDQSRRERAYEGGAKVDPMPNPRHGIFGSSSNGWLDDDADDDGGGTTRLN